MAETAVPRRPARVEIERRFALRTVPDLGRALKVRVIEDRYLDGTTLRLRRMSLADGVPLVHRLEQKVPLHATGERAVLHTTMELTADEYRLLGRLPGAELRKTRHRLRESGGSVAVDVFEGRLRGLALCEAEFDDSDAARAFTPPGYAGVEVSDDDRFSGARLVRASRDQLAVLLTIAARPPADRHRDGEART